MGSEETGGGLSQSPLADGADCADGEQGRAIPFITLTFDTDGSKPKFELAEQARAMLAEIEGPLSIISVVGMYRTGKSFLLNRILLGQKGGFPVGNTVNACTKGLWIWSKPLQARAANGTPVNLLVIDTEGLGSLDASTQHDCSIFALALLVSSFFIYNSVGSISESAVENLSLVVNLTKFIRVREGSEAGEEDGSQFASHFPKFLWVVRDFSLLLVDEDGRPITSKEYLDNALREIKGFSEKIVGKNRIRAMIRAFFEDRDCFPLVRPVEDEGLLQNLCQEGEEVLRPEFRNGMRALRARIFSSANPKLLHGAQLSGPMLVSLAESYVGAVNSGKVPSIKDAWSAVCETETRKQVEARVRECKCAAEKLLAGGSPLDATALSEWQQRLEAEAQAALAKSTASLGDAGAAGSRELGSALARLRDWLNKENDRMAGEKATTLLAELLLPLETRLDEGAYSNEISERGWTQLERDRAAARAAFLDQAPQVPAARMALLERMEDLLSRAGARAARHAELREEQRTAQAAEQLRSAEARMREDIQALQLQLINATTRTELMEQREAEGQERDRELRGALDEERELRRTELEGLREQQALEAQEREEWREEQISRARYQAQEQCRAARQAQTDAEQQLKEVGEQLLLAQAAREAAQERLRAAELELVAARRGQEEAQREGATAQGARAGLEEELGRARDERHLAEEARRLAEQALAAAASETAALRQTAEKSTLARDQLSTEVVALQEMVSVLNEKLSQASEDALKYGDSTEHLREGNGFEDLLREQETVREETQALRLEHSTCSVLLDALTGRLCAVQERLVQILQPEGTGDAAHGTDAERSVEAHQDGELRHLPPIETPEKTDRLSLQHEIGRVDGALSRVEEKTATLEASVASLLRSGASKCAWSELDINADQHARVNEDHGAGDGTARRDEQLLKEDLVPTGVTSTDKEPGDGAGAGSLGESEPSTNGQIGRSGSVSPAYTARSHHTTESSALQSEPRLSDARPSGYSRSAQHERSWTAELEARLDSLETTARASRAGGAAQSADALPQGSWWRTRASMTPALAKACRISTAETRTDRSGTAYTVYQLLALLAHGGTLVVHRRFSEFDELYHKLRRLFPHIDPPTVAADLFSSKASAWFNRFDPELIDCRRVWLEDLLAWVIADPVLETSSAFRSFLNPAGPDPCLHEALSSEATLRSSAPPRSVSPTDLSSLPSSLFRPASVSPHPSPPTFSSPSVIVQHESPNDPSQVPQTPSRPPGARPSGVPPPLPAAPSPASKLAMQQRAALAAVQGGRSSRSHDETPPTSRVILGKTPTSSPGKTPPRPNRPPPPAPLGSVCTPKPVLTQDDGELGRNVLSTPAGTPAAHATQGSASRFSMSPMIFVPAVEPS